MSTPYRLNILLFLFSHLLQTTPSTPLFQIVATLACLHVIVGLLGITPAF